MTIGELSIREHKKKKGKFGVFSKMPVKNRRQLSLAYTPGVGAVSQAVAKNPKLAYTLTSKGNMVGVVSDGSAVLGLGNIGPLGAMPVMEGKAVLFKEFAGIDAVPIVLATQDVDEIVAVVKAIAPTFGGINLEDISAPRCFEVEARLRKELDIPVFHDDQHGTAMVVVAALINALKVVGKKINQVKIVINGAGAAGNATAFLLLAAGATNIVTLDTKGIIYKGRDQLPGYKIRLAAATNPKRITGDLSEAVKKADVFIGLSKPGVLTTAMIKAMAKNPVVFAMANPVPEIMPEEARKAGASVIATGRSDFSNQINNVLIFPGFFRGLLDSGNNQITEKMQLAAARALASLTPKPTKNKILPAVFDKRVAKTVAAALK
ncbi:MAG: malate dehydrogenase [Candidatus Doudnabacteria bacterium RIFCSPHIGHO2_01_FULL_45_18]|uniref:Malate dehydrogenase n=1 Tax=Candidatus Doudnabacteria bacterium RIFCSPHIGHO2_01_FULL_45_18 TaxID=1817823 RepID=A0A1F5NRQ8_9BACT|nr:MAG: malate dehydrogenase [Candidatus Doudnabacteria bacterium RIFCSPHIGHO2_01_FULL_45_18]